MAIRVKFSRKRANSWKTSNFGLAVVAAYTGMKGDSEKARVLTQARAMVIRDYLAENFKLDDTRVKTIGRGETRDTDEISKVEIMVYPVGAYRPVAQNRSSAVRR